MPSPKPVRVLVVETAHYSRLPHDLAEIPGLEIVGMAPASHVSESIERWRPDVIAIDLHGPGGGLDAIRGIMASHPLPVVAVGENGDGGSLNFAALEAGALTMVQRPVEELSIQRSEQVANLVQVLKLMSEVRVVRRRPRLTQPPAAPLPSSARTATDHVRLVAIGASTGGPTVLQTILLGLPAGFPVPIVVVQHISNGFVASMVEWLQSSTLLRLQVAQHDELLQPGHVYFAPDQRQMAVAANRIVLGSAEPEKGHCPSVGYLFRSVARNYGPCAVGVLLTGMGKDGAEELLAMRRQGATTIAQSRESCIVYGMPGHAEELGAVDHFLTPDKIAPALMTLVMQKHPDRQHELMEQIE
jgi:two-component system chemotaxis response regulator CheB